MMSRYARRTKEGVMGTEESPPKRGAIGVSVSVSFALKLLWLSKTWQAGNTNTCSPLNKYNINFYMNYSKSLKNALTKMLFGTRS